MLPSKITLSELVRGSVAVDGRGWLLWELNVRHSCCRSRLSCKPWFHFVHQKRGCNSVQLQIFNLKEQNFHIYQENAFVGCKTCQIFSANPKQLIQILTFAWCCLLDWMIGVWRNNFTVYPNKQGSRYHVEEPYTSTTTSQPGTSSCWSPAWLHAAVGLHPILHCIKMESSWRRAPNTYSESFTALWKCSCYKSYVWVC